MKINRDDILMASVKLFAEKGYDAVSMSMIAGVLGVTKGALYRHFKNKQDIFEHLLDKMMEIDVERSAQCDVQILEIEKDSDNYMDLTVDKFCAFVITQFEFWTENEFAVNFRRMITLEQYRSPEMMSLYQDVICGGPVKYSADIFREMLMDGKFNGDAAQMGSYILATMVYAPLKLSIEMADSGADRRMLKENLRIITEEFKKRWTEPEYEDYI